MQLTLPVLRAMQYCSYKSWQLFLLCQSDTNESDDTITKDKIAETAWKISKSKISSDEFKSAKLAKHFKQAQELLTNTIQLLNKKEAPAFYKISHCSECQFRHDCFSKLKEKDCISLLAGMTPMVRIKYQRKGITTITQLSHLFRPRRRRQAPNLSSSYSWELKALAIRQGKTFVMQVLELPESSTSIYLDVEGVPTEDHYYLLGGLIVKDGEANKSFSLWSNNKDDEKDNFNALFDLLAHYSDVPIYHFGSYESQALKQSVKRWPERFKQKWVGIEKRMVNLLGYLRTHVYPPTYGNGLKEVAGFLGYKWHDTEADGFLSISWRKQWEETRLDSWKNKLIQYNQDDCQALHLVHQWFCRLDKTSDQSEVQQVKQMKKHTPYHLQSNIEYGEDFNLISKAAYFDYQRSKIYFRHEPKRQTPTATPLVSKPKVSGKGVVTWKPKKIHKIVIAPPLKRCPRCGCTKLYYSHSIISSFVQTDLKFTSTGIRQHVTEYRTGSAKCSKCVNKTRNQNLHMMHYGDGFFALVIHYYVNYHISNEMITKLMREQYGIGLGPIYLVLHKYRWWKNTWAYIAGYIRAIVLNSAVIHIDETTIRLSKESGYVWVFATTHTVFYHYTPTREIAFLKELLKDYKGIVVSDFFPGYETLNVKRQKCLIHLIRDLNDDLFKNPFDEEYKIMVTAFSKLLRSIIETIDKHGLKTIHLSRHTKGVEAFFNNFIAPDHRSELSIKYAKRLKKHWQELWTFLHHDNVPWNNNNAEVAVKAFAQHRHGVKGQMHTRTLNEFLQMLSIAQTCRYRNISFLSFLRRKKGIWENVKPEDLPGYLPFEQARLYVRRLGFERKAQWISWVKEGNRPSFIPLTPNSVYKKTGWKDWHDWIGFSFMPFNQARTFMRKLKLKNRDEYWAWLASGRRPKNIPYSPEKAYKRNGWIDLGDWLGTGNKGRQKKKMLTYKETKAYVQALGMQTQQEYFKWRKSGNRPETIPSSPNTVYAEEFEGWGEFLGTGRIANQNKKYLDYNKTKDSQE